MRVEGLEGISLEGSNWRWEREARRGEAEN